MKIHQSLASPLNGAIGGEISFSYVLFILQKFTGIKVFILSLAKSDKLEQGIDFFFLQRYRQQPQRCPANHCRCALAHRVWSWSLSSDLAPCKNKS